MSKLPTINLNKGRNKTPFLETFINWSLTIGRIIVIGTEAVALAAFLYRFTLDQQLVDLHTKIKQEEAEVNILKKNETTYRNLQSRLTFSRQLISLGSLENSLYHDLMSNIPSDVDPQITSLSTDSFHLDANTPSVNSLSSFINKLKDDKNISSISIDRLQNKTSLGIVSFSITTKLTKAFAKTK